MSQDPLSNKKPIINCHTHIFTGDHVPPYLAKTFVPSPLHYLVPLSLIVKGFRAYINHIVPFSFSPRHKRLKIFLYKLKIFIFRNALINILASFLALYVTIHVFFILFDWLKNVIAPDAKGASLVTGIRSWLEQHRLLFLPERLAPKLVLIMVVLLFVKTGRNLILFAFKKLWGFIKILPGPQTKELIKRYITIGRFSFHKKQEENYKRLRNQYPPDTGFVVLPMDMEFMGAGRLKPKSLYRNQMQELAHIKLNANHRDRFFPFVFVDPRRLRQEKDYFDYTVTEAGAIVLRDCFIKKYIEQHRFSGFKIYPALGYYPFDYTLLPLWKYAADNGLPILTHCIRGNIYYRGAKKKEWDFHPIFEQAAGKKIYQPLLLPEMKNIDFINNFTHPLNYLCLLEERVLRRWLEKADASLKAIFGFIHKDAALTSDLHHLKICFGHYGGEDEWKRFMEFDRDNYSSQLVKQPDWGIDFLTNEDGMDKPGKVEQIWRDVDWYSIISSLMLQYPQVYSDLSYILHDPGIQPLLRKTLQNKTLRRKILFGTDFYVVRNHKTEKQMLAEIQGGLGEADFDQIARENPVEFLKNTLPN